MFNPNHQNFTIPIEPHLSEVTNQDKGYFKLPELFDIGVSTIQINKYSYLRLDKNTHFLFECWACNYQKGASFWMYYFGPPSKAENFAFKLRLFNHGSKKEIHVSGPAISVDTYYRLMFGHSRAFKIPFGEIKEYWNQTEIALSWEVKVIENQTSQLKIIANTIKLD
jgi:hypothetical protein